MLASLCGLHSLIWVKTFCRCIKPYFHRVYYANKNIHNFEKQAISDKVKYISKYGMMMSPDDCTVLSRSRLFADALSPIFTESTMQIKRHTRL